MIGQALAWFARGGGVMVALGVLAFVLTFLVCAVVSLFGWSVFCNTLEAYL